MKRTRAGCCGLRIERIEDSPSVSMGELTLRAVSDGQLPRTCIFHVSLPPYTRHDEIYHRRTKEWFLVLRGRGRGVIGGRQVALKPGVVVFMPPGVPHQMMTHASTMEAIAVFSPPLRLSGKGTDVHRVVGKSSTRRPESS